MEILIKAAQFLLSLSILIILHEMGHFVFAKMFHTRVEKFYLFFNPWFSLFKVRRGETEYGMGWLPLGGYVKISGMIDESMDREQMKKPPQPHEFRAKPAWQRLLIMTGGVLVNFLLAIFIYSMMLFAWGEQYLPVENAKYGIYADSIALEMGLQHGDRIVSVGGEEVQEFRTIAPKILLDGVDQLTVKRNGNLIEIPVKNEHIAKLIKSPSFVQPQIPFYIDEFSEDGVAKDAGFKKGDHIVGINDSTTRFFGQFKSLLQNYKGERIEVVVERDGKRFEIPVTVPESGLLGIRPVGDMSEFFELKTIEYGFFESFPAGIKRGVNTVSSYLKQFRLLFKPETKAYESVGGFLRIGSFFPGEWNWSIFWNMTAFLSIILAVMNILPIPALDGGHVMFLLYEMVTGRKPGEKFLEYAQIVGMIILLSLLIFANANDIREYFF
jgi:regulator of sigma E protease